MGQHQRDQRTRPHRLEDRFVSWTFYGQDGVIMAVTAAVLALVLAGALVLLYAANRLTHPKIGA